MPGAVCFYMLSIFAMPQIPDGYSFQQDEAPFFNWTLVTEFMNQHFASIWLGRGGSNLWPH
jgi:hypothetical protein